MVRCCSGWTVDNVKPEGGGAAAAGRALRTAPLQGCHQLQALVCPPPSHVSTLEAQQRPPWAVLQGPVLRGTGRAQQDPVPCSPAPASPKLWRACVCPSVRLCVVGRGPHPGQSSPGARARAGHGLTPSSACGQRYPGWGVVCPRPAGSLQMPICLMGTDFLGQSENSAGSYRFPQTCGSAVTRATASCLPSQGLWLSGVTIAHLPPVQDLKQCLGTSVPKELVTRAASACLSVPGAQTGARGQGSLSASTLSPLGSASIPAENLCGRLCRSRPVRDAALVLDSGKRSAACLGPTGVGLGLQRPLTRLHTAHGRTPMQADAQRPWETCAHPRPCQPRSQRRLPGPFEDCVLGRRRSPWTRLRGPCTRTAVSPRPHLVDPFAASAGGFCEAFSVRGHVYRRTVSNTSGVRRAGDTGEGLTCRRWPREAPSPQSSGLPPRGLGIEPVTLRFAGGPRPNPWSRPSPGRTLFSRPVPFACFSFQPFPSPACAHLSVAELRARPPGRSPAFVPSPLCPISCSRPACMSSARRCQGDESSSMIVWEGRA